MPSWRFDRQVIRVALFLRERLRVEAGDAVLIASPLRPERAIAEWAVVTIGAVAVLGDVDAPLVAATPSAAFVATPAAAKAAREAIPALRPEAIVVFEPGCPPEQARAWSEVLDLGGTLDTPERAQSYRSGAERLAPGMPAVKHRARRAKTFTSLTHGEMVQRLESLGAAWPSGESRVAYLAAGGEPGAICWPLWAFTADGSTSTVFGTPGREVEEVAELDPDFVVGPSGLALPPRAPAVRAPSRLGDVLARLPWIGARVRAEGDTSRGLRPRHMLTFEGMRIS